MGRLTELAKQSFFIINGSVDGLKYLVVMLCIVVTTKQLSRVSRAMGRLSQLAGQSCLYPSLLFSFT